MTDTSRDNLLTRLRPLYGEEGLASLKQARVLVFGLGGVGSSCVEALARGGVGEIYLVDRDVIEPSNLNRQALAFTNTIGRSKVEVMQGMVAHINPDCKVETKKQLIMPDNINDLLIWAGAEIDGNETIVGPGQIDYVIDAIDTLTQKLTLAEISWRARIPLISSMGGANKIHPELLEFADIGKTHECRLSRTMRKECTKRRIKHLEVLYSPEKPVCPVAVAGSSHGGLSNLGTASFMPPVMGQMIAGRVIRALVGIEPWRWHERSLGDVGQ